LQEKRGGLERNFKMVVTSPSSTLVGRKLQHVTLRVLLLHHFLKVVSHAPNQKSTVLSPRLVPRLLPCLLHAAPAAAQDPSSIPGDPSFSNSAAWRAPSANLYISVREATGLP